MFRGDDWIGASASDLRAFAFWCLLSVAFVYPAMRVLQRRAGSAGSALLLAIASVAGIAFGVVWTFLVALVLGGWIGTFGFPVLLCWLAGSIAGFLVSAVLIQPRAIAAAACLAVVLPVSAATLLTWMSTPPPDAIVYFRPGTTDEQVKHVWTEVLSTPTPRGFAQLEGLQSMTAVRDDSRDGIRLTFQPGTSPEARAAVLDRARSVPFVDEVADSTPLTMDDLSREFPELRLSK